MAKRRKLSFNDLILANKQMKRRLPILLGEKARRWFEDSFNNEGFTDSSFRAWRQRKNKPRPPKILVDSSLLSNSIRRRLTSFRKTVISSKGVRYANFHNRGDGRLPQRQFIGNSKRLELAMKRIIERELNKAIKRKQL